MQHQRRREVITYYKRWQLWYQEHFYDQSIIYDEERPPTPQRPLPCPIEDVANTEDIEEAEDAELEEPQADPEKVDMSFEIELEVQLLMMESLQP